MSDDLSADMLAPSWPNLVLLVFSHVANFRYVANLDFLLYSFRVVCIDKETRFKINLLLPLEWDEDKNMLPVIVFFLYYLFLLKFNDT